MRIQQFLAFTGAVALSLSMAVPAFADPSVAPSLAAAGTAQGGVHLTAGHYMSREDAEHMRGTFLLADGRTIKVTSRMNKVFVDLDGKTEEMVPVGATTFVTRDTGARIAFNQASYPDEVVVDQAVR